MNKTQICKKFTHVTEVKNTDTRSDDWCYSCRKTIHRECDYKLTHIICHRQLVDDRATGASCLTIKPCSAVDLSTSLHL